LSFPPLSSFSGYQERFSFLSTPSPLILQSGISPYMITGEPGGTTWSRPERECRPQKKRQPLQETLFHSKERELPHSSIPGYCLPSRFYYESWRYFAMPARP